MRTTVEGQTIRGWSDNKIWMGSWQQSKCVIVAILVRDGFGGGVETVKVIILVPSSFTLDA